MKLVFLTIGHKQPPWLQDVSQIYQTKLNHFHPTEFHHLKGSALSREESEKKKKQETEILLKFVRDDDYLFVCDEKGEKIDSKRFSRAIERGLSSGKKRCVFIIGGAFGVEPSFLTRAQEVISLSPLVLNHYVALTVLMEQVYRGFTILRGLPYHNE